MTILDTDLERSFLDEFKTRLGKALAGDVDEPGLSFRAKGRDQWFEPRLTEVRPEQSAIRGRPVAVLWVVRCHVKVEGKGGKRLVLSQLVDAVRKALDPHLAAKPIRVHAKPIDGSDVGPEVGVLQIGTPSEVRGYNGTVQVRGDSIPGIDSATLTFPCQLDRSKCP